MLDIHPFSNKILNIGYSCIELKIQKIINDVFIFCKKILSKASV